MKRSLRFGDLHLRGGEPALLRPFLHPASKEWLPAAIPAADGLEDAAALPHRPQLLVYGRLETFEPHRERIEPHLRHRALAQGADDLVAALAADSHGPKRPLLRFGADLELLSEEVTV